MRAATGGLGRLPISVLVVALALTAAATGAAAPAIETAQDQAAPATPDANKPAPPTPDANKPAAPAAPEATPPPPPGTPPKNLQPIFPGDAMSILGKRVQGAAGEDMGRVVDILVDGEGQPRAAVIDFGGFLGVGSRKIAVDWRLLQFRPTDRKAPMQLSVTRAEVQAAPEYKEKNEPTQVVGPPAEAPAAPDAAK
jgi:PRC-barrel domain